MRKLFDIDNPVFQLLARMTDLVVLGLLCLVCCVPVVTIGPAVTALFKAVYDLTIERGGGMVRTYFRAFRTNFKQTVTVWLMALVGFASLGCNWFLLKLYYQGASYEVLAWLVLIFALVLVAFLCYIFPLIARYENTLRQHAQNAAILLIRYFPRTMLMVLIQMLPLLMLLHMPYAMMQTLLFWILFYAGFAAQANAFILQPVFNRLEAKPEDQERPEEPEE